MSDLAQIKKVSLQDLHHFLSQDHTSFTVLSASLKHILSTNRCTVSLTKNSSKYFYRNQLNQNQLTEYLLIFGGLAFGLNALIVLAK